MPSKRNIESFTIVDNFKSGYRDKRDVTKESPGTAITGSLNIVTVDAEKIGIRSGYTRIGSANSSLTGIKGGGNWKTSRGTEIPWRNYDDELEFYSDASWHRLSDGFPTSAIFRGASIWDTGEVQDLFIFVNGDSNLYMWSGGIANFASATSNTITKEGTSTWAESGFITTASYTKSIDIEGTSYTYTGGEGTTTLTGVLPDPTVAGHTISAIVNQSLQTVSNKPGSTFSNDFVQVLDNHLYVFSKTERGIFISSNTDFTDFTFSATRLPGEGAFLILDETPTASASLTDKIAISSRNYWYVVVFTLSSDNANETVSIKRLKNSPLEGASFDLAITSMKNYTITMSNEPSVNSLGEVENILTPQNVNFSDAIKNTMDITGVDEATAFFHKNNLYFGVKDSIDSGSNNRIYVRNLATGSWETPWTIPASVIFEYNGELYFHSSVQPETYKLLDTYTDNGLSVTATWLSSHEDYNYPFNQKRMDTMWIDGYIRTGTDLTIKLNYDFGSEFAEYTLKGTNTDVVITSTSGGLGAFSLGTRSLGGRGKTLKESGLRRFRGFIAIEERDFYELQVGFESAGTDQRWEIVEYGLNISILDSQDNNRLINNI